MLWDMSSYRIEGVVDRDPLLILQDEFETVAFVSHGDSRVYDGLDF